MFSSFKSNVSLINSSLCFEHHSHNNSKTYFLCSIVGVTGKLLDDTVGILCSACVAVVIDGIKNDDGNVITLTRTDIVANQHGCQIKISQTGIFLPEFGRFRKISESQKAVGKT